MVLLQGEGRPVSLSTQGCCSPPALVSPGLFPMGLERVPGRLLFSYTLSRRHCRRDRAMSPGESQNPSASVVSRPGVLRQGSSTRKRPLDGSRGWLEKVSQNRPVLRHVGASDLGFSRPRPQAVLMRGSPGSEACSSVSPRLLSVYESSNLPGTLDKVARACRVLGRVGWRRVPVARRRRTQNQYPRRAESRLATMAAAASVGAGVAVGALDSTGRCP